MKKSCVIYDSWAELIDNLPDEMAGQLMKMVLGYAFGEGYNSSENPAINAMFAMIKVKLDEDDDKYKEKAERMKNNSSRSRNDIDTISTRYQNDVEGVSDSVSVSVSDKEDKDILSDAVSEIVDYLNDKAGTKYKASTKSTVSSIKGRIAEGYTLDDFKTVIDKKVKAWKDDPKMAAYLRPETLFRPGHFESYLNEIEVNKGSPTKTFNDMTEEKYKKIHSFSGERQIDYDELREIALGQT